MPTVVCFSTSPTFTTTWLRCLVMPYAYDDICEAHGKHRLRIIKLCKPAVCSSPNSSSICWHMQDCHFLQQAAMYT
jgi:hypothetical protein